MTARRFPFPLLAVVLFCSLSPAAPPDAKEPAKEGKAVGKPVLVPVWKKTTIGLPKEDDLSSNENKVTIDWLAARYDRVVTEYHRTGRPLVPPAVPLPVSDGLLYVNDQSVALLSLTHDKTIDPPIVPGDLLWASDFGVWKGYRDADTRRIFDKWSANLDEPISVANNTLRCSLRFDGRKVFLVDELSLPPPVKLLDQMVTVLRRNLEHAEDFRDYEFAARAFENDVRSADVESGKLTAKLSRDYDWIKEPKTRAGNICLGAPLTIGSRVFVLHEKSGDVRLTVHAWEKVKLHAPAKDGVLWSADLASAPNSLIAEPHRRIHATYLTQAGDLVLCPTHLGRVVAVESKTGKIKWTHEYAPLDAKRFPTFAPEWVVVPPVVVGDKYVYAPADFPELLCLNVTDGKKVWSVKKGDGLYPAVVGEQVLVIGEKTVRSLDLKDGSEKWKLDLPGLPCGRGAILSDHYLVPVSEPKTWRGMIAMVDVKNGKISEVIKPDKDEPVGNLVVHQEFLISQTLSEIAVFPIKK